MLTPVSATVSDNLNTALVSVLKEIKGEEEKQSTELGEQSGFLQAVSTASTTLAGNSTTLAGSSTTLAGNSTTLLTKLDNIEEAIKESSNSSASGVSPEIGSIKDSGKNGTASVTVENEKGGYVYVRPLSSSVDCMVSIDGKGEVSAKTLNENQMSMAVSMPKIASISNSGATFDNYSNHDIGVGAAFPSSQSFSYSGEATSTPEPVTTKIYFHSKITIRASNNAGSQFEYVAYVY